MEFVYNGPAQQVHPELGLLQHGKTYDVSREQARWLSPEAGWSPKGKVRETRAKLERDAEKAAATSNQASEVPGTPDVTGDTVGGRS